MEAIEPHQALAYLLIIIQAAWRIQLYCEEYARIYAVSSWITHVRPLQYWLVPQEMYGPHPLGVFPVEKRKAAQLPSGVSSHHRTGPPPSGLYMESTRDERLGVLPGEDRLVRDVMSLEVVTISPSHSLKDAARLMRDRQVPALIVTEDERLIGILTEHDMVIHGMTRDTAPHMMPVRQVLGDRAPIACREQAILAEAAQLMAEHRLQSLPVMNAGGAVVGHLSLLDIAGAVMPNVAAAWLSRIRKERDRQHRTTPR